MTHLFLHILAPVIIASIFYRQRWALALAVMLATMLVDLDHLLANPIYDSGRCSIGFHPLHQVWLIAIYFGLCFFPKTNLVGAGLMIHMVLDQMDCEI